MTSAHDRGRRPLSDAYARLGRELSRVRQVAGKTTRDIQKPDGSFYQSGSISNVEGGYSQPSVDLIKAYARLGGRYVDLITLLDQARRPKALTPEPVDEFDAQLLDPRTDPYALRRGYVIDLQEDTAYFGPNRQGSRNVHTVALRPLSPHARYFVLRYGYEEDPRRGVAMPQAGPGCDIALVEEDDEGTIYVVLDFKDAPRDPFDRAVFSWTIHIRSSSLADPVYAVHTNALIRQVIQRVQFESPALPAKLWWFRGTDPFQDTVPQPPEHLLPLNATNFYFHEFYDVEREMCGLAWRW